MAILDLEQAFPTTDRQPRPSHRTYDVRITLNKSGHGKPVIRFGVINKAANTFGEFPFIEASNIEYTKDRIYFRTHTTKSSTNIHVLSSNGKTRQDSCYFTITPSDKGEKMYRMNWIGKLFPLLRDDENDLYYIDYKEEN